MQQISVIKACHAVSQTEIYAMDSIIHPSNDWGQNSNQFYRESTKLQSTDKNSLTQAQKNTSSQVVHDSYEDMADVLQDRSNCILKQNLNSRTCWAWITDPKKKNTILLHVVCLTCKGLFLKSSNWRYPLPFNIAPNDCPSGDVSLLSPRNKSLRFWLNFTALTKRQDSDQHKFRYFKS